MRAGLLMRVLRGSLTLHSVGRVALGGTLLVLAGCHSSDHTKQEGDTGKVVAAAVMDIPESSDLQIAGFAKGHTSAQLGENLQVWYKDFGDSVLIVTASAQRVLLHVNANGTGNAAGGGDVVYGSFDNGTVCSQYARSQQSPAACGEHQSSASVTVRRNGYIREDWWALPKRELTTSGRSAFLTFEVFDETTQSSRFFPEAPYATAKLSFGGGPPEPSAIVPTPPPPSKPDRNPAQASSASGNGNEPVRQHSLETPQVRVDAPKPPPTSERDIGCVEPCYAMQLSSLGQSIEQGKRYVASDPRFAHGTNLILSVHYEGADPNRTELAIAWYVGKKPVSFFPALKVPRRSGDWLRAYDNDTVEPGEHRIVLTVNGQEMDQPRLSFWVDPEPTTVPAPASPPQAAKQPDGTHKNSMPFVIVGTTQSRQQ